jgi:quercetin dioxygenase-like cupin family protein
MRAMEHRRALLKTLLSGSLLAAAPAPSPAAATVVRRQALSGDFDGMEAIFVELNIEPGQGSRSHRHPGFVLGYVVEGQFRFAIQGQPEQVLGPGEVFYEPPDAVHVLSESANDKPARVLAIIVAEKGAPLTMPA